MNKILVPTDFSTFADKALDYAVGIAKKAQAEIVLLHCYEPVVAAFGITQEMVMAYDDTRVVEFTAALTRYKTAIEESENVKVTIELSGAGIVDAVIETSDKHQASLIVMGTLGATGLKTLFFGTKTAAVISRTTKPVIAVPYDYEWSEPKEFLLAVSDAHEDMANFQPVVELAKLFKVNIRTIIFSNEKAEGVEVMEHSRTISEMQKKLQTAFEGTAIQTDHISGKDLHESLQEYIKEQNADLLVMITHKRTFLQNLFHFSATKQMTYHTTIPLLSLHSTH